MNSYEIVYLTTARKNLDRLWDYVKRTSGEVRADKFLDEIMQDCESLRLAPLRGVIRTRLGRKVRVIGMAKGRVSVAFDVVGNEVQIIAVKYAGWKLGRKDR